MLFCRVKWRLTAFIHTKAASYWFD